MKLRISIPSSQHEYFRRLAAISDEQFASFVEELRQLPGTGTSSEIEARALGASNSETADALQAGIRLALGVKVALERYGARDDSSVQELVRASAIKDVSPEQADLGAERLGILIGVPAIRRVAKSTDLAMESHRLVTSVRLLTDLRPVFNETPDGPAVEAAIVLHRLRIEVHDGDDLVLTFDPVQLSLLQNAISRAQAKAQSLKSALKGTELEVIAQSLFGEEE